MSVFSSQRARAVHSSRRQRGTTTYLAIAMSADQNRRLLLHACVGQTYTTLGAFDPESELFESETYHAAARFASRSEWVTAFDVVAAGRANGDEAKRAKRAVRAQAKSVLDFSFHRPDRSLRTVAPIGKVLREFDVRSNTATGTPLSIFSTLN